MNTKILFSDIDPRFDRDAILNRIGAFLDKCDPDDRVKVTIDDDK